MSPSPFLFSASPLEGEVGPQVRVGGNGAAAFADDAGDQVVGGAAHGALARLAGDGMGFAVGIDEGYAHFFFVSLSCDAEGFHPLLASPIKGEGHEFVLLPLDGGGCVGVFSTLLPFR